MYVATVDGSSSASDSDRGTTPSRVSDAERELDDLRARAYGPKSDIESDPAAMARLIELEAAHVGAAPPGDPTESVGSRAANSSSRAPAARESVAADAAGSQAKPTIPTTPSKSSTRRTLFLVGSTVVVAMLVFAATWLHALPPDAILRPTVGEPDDRIIQTLMSQGEVPDPSTLRQFERYHDLDVWSVENRSGDTCIIAYNRGSMGRFQFHCGPPAVELVLHMPVGPDPDDSFGDWLPSGSVVSLHLRENTVAIFVHSPPPAT